jgi:predicted CoA-substrate-specific enzyme activase
LLRDGVLVAYAVVRNEGRFAAAAEQSVQDVLADSGVSLHEVVCRGAIGWGDKYIPFPHASESAFRCLARGALSLVPGAGTIVDIGGLSTAAVRVDAEGGRILDYATNDRCASGTGFFLEMAAQALELSVEELGPISLSALGRAHISAQCAVFGESEIVTHLNEGAEPADIAAGITHAIGASVASMLWRLGVEREVVVTGGVAKNVSVVAALEEHLGLDTVRPELDPQVIGALGAALRAMDSVQA